MKIEYDPKLQVAYIQLADVPSSFGIIDRTQELTDNVLVDWMKDGTLYGIEILGVDKIEEVIMGSIIIENVRGQWIVDKDTAGIFEKEGVGYGNGALMELKVANCKSLCCHPNSPAVCPHKIPSH